MRKFILFISMAIFAFGSMFYYSQTQNKQDKEPITIESNWYDNTVIYEVNIRQYTKDGTFNAFSAHLDRLKDLGVQTLWFMPIQPISIEKRKGSLGSYYAVADYRGINHEFGTKEDFKNLVDYAHDLGFKVMLDWVANHTGWDHPWITDHPDYYIQNSKGEIVHPVGTDWTDVAELDYNNENMRTAMIDDMLYWVKEFNIDGYRFDDADGSPNDFWIEVNDALRSEKKDFYMLAESDKYQLLKDGFNLTYSWELHHMLNDLAKDDVPVSNLKSYLKRVVSIYPDQKYPMNFTSNHDENSWNGTVFERLGESYKTMAMLTFTVPGVPLIYSGQEAGLDHRLAFFEKDQIDWSNLSYTNFYKSLIQLKKDNSALTTGPNSSTLEVFNSTNNDVISFVRYNDDNKVIVLVNLSDRTQKTEIDYGNFSGEYQMFDHNNKFLLGTTHSFNLGPWEYIILTQ